MMTILDWIITSVVVLAGLLFYLWGLLDDRNRIQSAPKEEGQ